MSRHTIMIKVDKDDQNEELDYFKHHREPLEKALTAALDAVIRARAPDPFRVLIEHLSKEGQLQDASKELDVVHQKVGSSALNKMKEKLNSKDPMWLKEQFKVFDKNGDGSLSRSELSTMLSSIFGTELSVPENDGTTPLDRLLEAMDGDGDGDIDLNELECSWRSWFGAAVHPVRALLIIDVQNDFIDGSLALKHCPAGQDGGAVVPIINKILHETPGVHFDKVICSLDWHPANHCSFHEVVTKGESPSPFHPSQDAAQGRAAGLFTPVTLTAPDGESAMTQMLWPAHCVSSTWGAAMPESLKVSPDVTTVYKGTDACIDSYSAFYDNHKLKATTMLGLLRNSGVTHVYIVGLALDVCVTFSALHAAEEGFVTAVIEDACAGVSKEGIEEKKDLMREAGVSVVTSAELPDLMSQCSLHEALAASKRIGKVKKSLGEVRNNSGHGSGPVADGK